MADETDCALWTTPYQERFVDDCAEITEAFRALFRERYERYPEGRAALIKFIENLNCEQIEANWNKEEYKELWGIVWYAALKYDLNRVNIDRAFLVVKFELRSGRLFPPKN